MFCRVYCALVPTPTERIRGTRATCREGRYSGTVATSLSLRRRRHHCGVHNQQHLAVEWTWSHRERESKANNKTGKSTRPHLLVSHRASTASRQHGQSFLPTMDRNNSSWSRQSRWLLALGAGWDNAVTLFIQSRGCGEFATLVNSAVAFLVHRDDLGTRVNNKQDNID